MNYEEFVKLVDQTSKNFNWRYGQALMNVLHGVWPSKYHELTDLELDCYYREDLVAATLKFLKNEWKPTNEQYRK
jgi:hypothetical protein